MGVRLRTLSNAAGAPTVVTTFPAWLALGSAMINQAKTKALRRARLGLSIIKRKGVARHMLYTCFSVL